jgi:hypothetical protein
MTDLTATFEDLEFQPHPTGGEQAKIHFKNGYGASVIRTPHSLGGNEGLYELAVTRGRYITYDTPITDDVLGYLTPDRVSELLQQIEALP